MANFNFNKVILGGRLTAEPELKQTPNGTPVVSFSVAVNRRVAKGAEQKTDFINCVAWRQTAEFISRYFHKGSCICIVGNIQVRSWTDQNNQKRYATEVIVDEANFVDSASENRGGQSAGYNPYAGDQGGFASPAEDASHFEQVENEDDLPF
ncbi:MAG: single-stranded DNA-binding protein [Clostridia bacterium]|nr:single-stranded DNA-binding protein [Clostridia bacterium]MBQ8215885.1 single-stranded DNA-binding protein [Clostridia bacterium]